MIRVAAFQVWFILCITYSLYRGGGAERAAAILQIVAQIASLSVNHFQFQHSYVTVRGELWAIDALLLIGLYIIALRSTRFWPLWIAGFQLLGVAGHVLRAMDTSMLPHGYQTIVNGVAWPMLAIMATGTVRHRVRLRRYGTDDSWLISSRPLILPPRLAGLMR